MGNAPTADRILSLLADLYADQTGVKIDYEIKKGCAAPRARTARSRSADAKPVTRRRRGTGRKKGGEAHVSIH